MGTIDTVIAHITETATLSDLNLISEALENRCAEEAAQCDLMATPGTYVTLWNCDPSYLDGLRGTITSICEDRQATVLLDPTSATMLRFNLEAREDGYVTTHGADEGLQVCVSTQCCQSTEPVDAPEHRELIDALMAELATM